MSKGCPFIEFLERKHLFLISYEISRLTENSSMNKGILQKAAVGPSFVLRPRANLHLVSKRHICPVKWLYVLGTVQVLGLPP